MLRTISLKGTDRDIISEVRRSIEKDPISHFTIDNIASKMGINQTKLKSGFKLLFGVGIYEYQVQCRMRKAEVLLITSDKDLKWIAQVTGYKNNSSFNVAFKKKHAGVAPLQWRKVNSAIAVE